MRNKKLAAFVAGGVCLLVLVVFAYFELARVGEVSIDETKYYPVSYVVDGDTFKAMIGSREITVRVLGINTPETVDPRKPVECYGLEASAEMKSLIAGRTVRLVFNPNRERQDKYGRYLLYVYRDDGLFVNDFLIKEGYAREYTVGTPYSFQSEFRADEQAAKIVQKGLWGKCEPLPSFRSY
jgi:micrococcal nuclease